MNKLTKGFIILLIICLFYFLFVSDYFQIDHVDYNVSEIYDVNLKRDTTIYGGNFFLLTKNQIKHEMNQYTFIESVVIKKNLPDTLQLQINYKEPFLVINDNNINVLIDASKEVLAVNKNVDQMLTITGLQLYNYQAGEKITMYDDEFLNRIIDLITLINKSHVEINQNIAYNGKDVVIKTDDGFRVNFGQCRSIEQKFNNFINIYETLSEQSLESKGTIDVSITKLPIYKPAAKN
jgi:cell division septal protein FtsQ